MFRPPRPGRGRGPPRFLGHPGPRGGPFGGPPPFGRPRMYNGRIIAAEIHHVHHIHQIHTGGAPPLSVSQPHLREIYPINIGVEQGGSVKRFCITLPPDVEAGMTITVLLDQREFQIVCPDFPQVNERIIVVVPAQNLTAHTGISPSPNGQRIDGVATLVHEKETPLANHAYSLPSDHNPAEPIAAHAVYSSSSKRSTASNSYACPACTYDNSSHASVCEMCATPLGMPVATPVGSDGSEGFQTVFTANKGQDSSSRV